MRTKKLLFISAALFLGITLQAESVLAAESWEVSCDSLQRMNESFLKFRWTDGQVNSLIAHIKQGRDLDSLPFLKKFPRECGVSDGYDLRGIRLFGRAHFKGYSVELPYVHLEKSVLKLQDLQNAVLFDAHFEDAELGLSDLSGARCHNAHFERVKAYSVKFEDAVLFGCDFHGATLVGASFKNAELNSADFEGGLLVGADFSGADLMHAKFKNTFLQDARLDDARCRDIHWDGYFVGEERSADLMARALKEPDAHLADARYKQDFEKVFGYSRRISPLVREDIMLQGYTRAKYTYRYLKNIYQSYDLAEIAKEFHYRENRVATKMSGNPFSWLARKLLFEWTYGYGARPWWLLRSSGIVVLFFTVGFLLLSFMRVKSGIYRIDEDQESQSRISVKSLKGVFPAFGNALYFSLLTFVTFGYGTITPQQWVRLLRLEQVDLKPVRWARIAAALESLAGIYLLALFAKVILGR
jgi:uncharacterized protein YjbI with pentapeptide repeats